MSRTRAIWHGMKNRCSNPKNPAYADYGGRGIKVCERWLSYLDFLADMGECPSQWHSIERINVDGDYCPENCKWLPLSQQAQNKRNTKRPGDYQMRLMRIRQWQKRRETHAVDFISKIR